MVDKLIKGAKDPKDNARKTSLMLRMKEISDALDAEGYNKMSSDIDKVMISLAKKL